MSDDGVTLLEAESLSVRYRNGAVGLSDVSLQLSAGEVVAICGANGAGKTTTVRAITGLLRSEGTKVVAGAVRVGGRDVTNWEPHDVSALGVYVIPERRKIFANLTVMENLTALGSLPPRAERSRRLDAVFEVFPGIAQRKHLAAGRLSGGQQQMLALGRALMADARVLVIDEIALGLHPSLLQPLYETVRGIVGTERGAIVVNEDVRSASGVADRFYELSDGRVARQGSVASALVASAQEGST